MLVRVIVFALVLITGLFAQEDSISDSAQDTLSQVPLETVAQEPILDTLPSAPVPEPLAQVPTPEQTQTPPPTPAPAPAPATAKFRIQNVAVLAIEGAEKDFQKEDLKAIAGRFETELAKAGKVLVLERRNMDLILQEQGFQQSGACNSSECQVQVGELLGVDRIITGSIVKVDKLYTLNMKMVDVESGKNVMSHAIDIRGSLEDVLRGGCFEMAQIFSGIKKPSNDHTILTAEKRSIWPWIVGGVGVVAISGGVILFLNSNKSSSKEKTRTIDNWSNQ